MKSPCLTCDLYAQSKDNPVCKECEERIRYVNAIDGIQLPDSALRVRKRAFMGKLKKGEIYIQSVCDQYHIELSDLKSRKFGGNLREIRKQIINTLRYDHKLSMKDIGKLLNKTQQAISRILNPADPKPTTHIDTEKEVKQLDKEDIDTSDDKKFIFIDFKKVTRLDLWDSLIAAADRNFRTVEGHALYLINKGLNDEQP